MAARLIPIVLVATATAATARADNTCHVVAATFVPADQLQLVAWVEKPDGTYVDTIYITSKVGHYGIGNRPGRFDFNSGPIGGDMWPYGRRETVFPVWAHRHGKTFPKIVFQNGNEDNLSHPFDQSSAESSPPFCRPILPSEDMWDALTCSTPVFSDKGTFAPDGSKSLYPPRADIKRQGAMDSLSVDQYRALDPFDAVSQATPAGGQCAQITWPIPETLAQGDYVLWIEASGEFDFNGTYNASSLPAPINIPWSAYGQPYRGQPSVVYSVPFSITSTESSTSTANYIGYGDANGATGTLHAPDATITIDTPGSGAGRLEIIPGSTDRLRVTVRPESDSVAPGAPTALAVQGFSATSATLSFDAPGDDGYSGSVAGYEIRVSANEMTAASFSTAMEVATTVTPGAGGMCGVGGVFPPAGAQQSFEVQGLLPETDYWVGVRAFDKCHNTGDLAIAKLTTPAPKAGYVNACFVATAAYGTIMANDVEMLRRFRDVLLRRSVLGELAIEAYYTFGPPVAGAVGESDLLRRAARDALAPIVDRVRGLAF